MVFRFMILWGPRERVYITLQSPRFACCACGRGSGAGRPRIQYKRLTGDDLRDYVSAVLTHSYPGTRIEPIANLDDVLPFAIIGLGVLLVVASLFGGSRRGERRAR